MLTWLVPGVMAVAVTAIFLLLLPTQDRKVRLELPAPFIQTEQEPVGRLELPVAPWAAPEARDVRSAPPVAGGVFKWTDAKGRVHYGDKPPKGSGAQAVEGSGLNVSVVTMPAAPVPQARIQAPPPANRAQPAPSYAAPQDSLPCQQVKDEIAWIDSRLRQGYKVRMGESLKARRRDLVKLRAQYCH